MFDYHIHSVVSIDGCSTMAECARSAVEKGFSEICVTEHCDYDYPFEGLAKPLDLDAYRAALQEAREAVPGLRIRAGVELSLMPGPMEKERAMAKAYPFDFIIGSQHTVDGKDPWLGDFFVGRTVREGHRRYLEEIYANVTRTDDFDVIGHIGYVDKYLYAQKIPLKDPQPFEYKDFPELIDEILRSVIDRGKGIEINTSNYAVHGYPTPHPGIIRRYAELGGEVLTTGSDAHKAEQVGRRFADAYALLRAVGVRYVCTFDRRKPVFHRLDSR